MKELEYYLATLIVVPVVIGTIIPDILGNILVYRQVKSDLEKKEETRGQGPKVAFDSAKEIIKEHSGHGLKSFLNIGEILAAKSYMRNYKSLYSEPKF
jgi:hypothetical protein